MTETQANTPVVTAPVAVKPGLPVKLTTEEMNLRYQFIGKCADKGVTYPATRVFGQNSPMTITDLCNATVNTLQNIAKALKKAEQDHDPEFNGTDELKIAKIPAKDWLQFFRLTIRKKSWDIYASEVRAQRKEIQAELDKSKTPEERKKDLQEQLTALGGVEDDD